ncbi:AT-hook motif nuclear-localized protein 7-like [Phalaenopsis equestris]|uniref:AT-hook motif nuclear-localized protein 7-like n=1 Tax=Phalaenopsis equestris TaxID=78828 RepID=UPI0009E5948F|nr:AT-hook motif nuclear-localized protein 7-like [Phalaenopsis equestris]
MSVKLAGTDGHVVGGIVAGILMAATPVQVVVGSFLAKKKPKPRPKSAPVTHEPSLAMPQMSGFDHTFALCPPSQASSSDSDDDRGTPINHNSGYCSNSNYQFQGQPSYSVGWIG